MEKNEKKYGLLKGALILIFFAIILSWLIPNGQYSSSGYATEGTLTRVGITDISWLIYYGLYFGLDKIIMLLAIGGMYGVLVKVNAYDKLTSGIANKLKPNVAVILFSVIIAILTSMLTQTFTVLIFIPFIVSILHKMKLDKITIIATTFGSMLVGTMGATFGTEGLIYLKNYLTADGFDPNKTILIRAGIMLVGLVLFNFFTLAHLKKVDKKAASADMFITEEISKEKDKKKGSSIIPIVIVGLLLFIIVILGYIDWSNWGVFVKDEETIFETFHNTLMDIKIGDFAVFQSILGSNLSAFGKWDIFSIAAIIVIFTGLMALCYRVKFSDFITNFGHGLKRMLKPCLVIAAALILMVVVYMSPYMATIINKLLGITDGFNLATMTVSSFIMNIFHTDLGFTGYIAGSYLAQEYIDYINPIYVIFSSIYGYVQFFIPTSIILGVGLTTLDVKYTDWLKHIWKFLVGMLICLLIVFILITVF